MVSRALVAALVAGAALPASAAAAPWATVNVCDTAAHPDTIGIRASMPGSPRGARAGMRFQVQYLAAGRWRAVAGTDSGWRGVGVTAGAAIESGWTFKFASPVGRVTLRGFVRFRWRRHGHTVRRAHRVTSAGHRSRIGADPAGYSAATCALGS
jgi:hypothetical protein